MPFNYGNSPQDAPGGGGQGPSGLSGILNNPAFLAQLVSLLRLGPPPGIQSAVPPGLQGGPVSAAAPPPTGHPGFQRPIQSAVPEQVPQGPMGTRVAPVQDQDFSRARLSDWGNTQIRPRSAEAPPPTMPGWGQGPKAGVGTYVESLRGGQGPEGALEMLRRRRKAQKKKIR